VSSFPGDINPEYGEPDVKFLRSKFGFSFRDVKVAYRQDNHGSITTNLEMLLNSVALYL